MKLWAAIAASRIERCDFALPMVRDYLPGTGDRAGRVSAAMVLARCSAWEEALQVAKQLELLDPALAELTHNVEWAEVVAREDHQNVEGALRWSRAQTLLLQRGQAYAALVPWQQAILSDAQASVFLARTAWAAGEDDVARRALATHLAEAEASTLLASWSRELGRE
jgi:hypothetical protein